MKYKILEGTNALELERKVIEYLAKGYQLAGGHQVTTVGYRDYTNTANALREIVPNQWNLTQAVFKPDKKEEEKVYMNN